MHLVLLLIPWIFAIIWTVWTKSFIITGLLVIGCLWQLWKFSKIDASFNRILITAILYFSWFGAAYLAGKPVIIIGMLIQLAAFIYIESTSRAEKREFAAIIANYEEQISLLYELRKQRHDLQKHASALQHADAMSEQVKEYKSELYSRYTDVDQVLRSESNVVAGALFAYREKARENGTELEYHFQHAISGLPLSEYERISLLGNILQNAIEAAYEYEEVTGKHGKVVFSCRKQSGIWILICQNSTTALDPDTIERIFTNRAKSTKGGSHEGIGTQQVMRIVKSHGGTLDFSAIQNNFTLKIKIPDIQD